MSPGPALDHIVTFDDGLPGFESCRRFVLVTSSALEPFSLLQGAGPGAPSFVAIDPRRIRAGFETTIGEADRLRLGAQGEPTLLWLALVAAQPDGTATVNLRAPIVINPASMKGVQILSSDSADRLDHPFAVE